MSTEPAAQPNSRGRDRCPREWEVAQHLSAEDFEHARRPLADLFLAMANRGKAEGWLVEVDTPQGKILVAREELAGNEVEAPADEAPEGRGDANPIQNAPRRPGRLRQAAGAAGAAEPHRAGGPAATAGAASGPAQDPKGGVRDSLQRSAGSNRHTGASAPPGGSVAGAVGGAAGSPGDQLGDPLHRGEVPSTGAAGGRPAGGALPVSPGVGTADPARAGGVAGGGASPRLSHGRKGAAHPAAPAPLS